MLWCPCRALKAEADAQRAVEREKQREMLKDIKEKSKADKEKQKQVGHCSWLVWHSRGGAAASVSCSSQHPSHFRAGADGAPGGASTTWLCNTVLCSIVKWLHC